MSIKTDVQAEKTKLLDELHALEAKAKAELADLKAKAKGLVDISAEVKEVESALKADVQKVEKWFVSHFKKQAQPVVAPSAQTAVTK